MVREYHVGEFFPVDEIWLERRITYRPGVSDLELAAAILPLIPAEADGIYYGLDKRYHGRPFFYVGIDSDHLHPGEFFWYDKPIRGQIGSWPCATIEIGLELQGGLGGIMARSMQLSSAATLEVAWLNRQRATILDLLTQVENTYLLGSHWFNLCAGEGTTVEEVLLQAGAIRVIHVDSNPLMKFRYLAGKVNGEPSYQQNYLVKDVTGLTPEDLEGKCHSLKGILLCHPSDPTVIEATFRIASEQLKKGGYVLLALDKEDTPHVEQFASLDHFSLTHASNRLPITRIYRLSN
ncbi:MAG: hypothetical protein ABIG95_04115 [Candidatus Woesearchaeota archaeon]